MAWATPQYSKSQVDRAGQALVIDPESYDPDEYEAALRVINNWRSSHSFPLNTFQVTLRRNARAVDGKALVAQRIKRLSSIEHKLTRFPTMKLSQMQDIGGCRAVLSNAARVRALRNAYVGGNLKHDLVREDDYITKPRASGYRGVHLIYRYQSDKKQTYNGLLLEVQLRSQLQHAWATAVETVGTFLQQALKASEGPERWLRFFALMGSAIALREGTALVPGVPEDKGDLFTELRQLARSVHVQKKLESYGKALQTLEHGVRGPSRYYLLALEPAKERVTVTSYVVGDLDRATEDYLAVERSLAGQPGAEAVLVSVESLESLRRAYPNYFLDTRVFIEAVRAAMVTK